MGYRIPFSGRAHGYSEDEVKAVCEVMRNGESLTQGQQLKRFEEKFSEYVGVNRAYALSSAASALELVAQMCRFKKSDEVIIPAHTYTASALPFAKHGANLVWADLDLETRVVTVDHIRPLITANSRVLVVVHLYGYAVDMPSIMDLAREKNLIVVEDAAQAVGVRIQGRHVGTYGDFGVFSFHSHKNISTLGEGGMLVVRDESLGQVVPLLRHNGHSAFDPKREFYWKPAMGNVVLPEIDGIPLMPNNFSISEVQCAVGSCLLDRVDDINRVKRQRALQFIDSLVSFENLVFHRHDSERHNYHLLVAQVVTGNRDLLIQKLAEIGIQCVVQYCPLYRYDLYKKLGFSDSNCPNTDLFFDNMISFPFHYGLSDSDLEWMVKTVKKVLGSGI